MINKLIQLVVETGFLTGVCPSIQCYKYKIYSVDQIDPRLAALAVIQLSLYNAFKDTEYFMTPAGALSKAYSNSLLVLLNNRGALRQKRDNMTVGNSVTLPHLQSTRPIQINVNQETFAERSLAVGDFPSDKVRAPSVPLLHVFMA